MILFCPEFVIDKDDRGHFEFVFSDGRDFGVPAAAAAVGHQAQDVALVVCHVALDGVAARDARRHEGPELDDVGGGELEGVEVGPDDFAVAPDLLQLGHDAVVGGTASVVDQEDLGGVHAVGGDQFADEDLVRSGFRRLDLELDGQGVADLGRVDVVAEPVRDPHGHVWRLHGRRLHRWLAVVDLQIGRMVYRLVGQVVVASNLQPDVGTRHNGVMVL